MTVDTDALRNTMRKWASAITVVTSISGEQRAGVTASSFTSVALEPPTILICLQDYIKTYHLIQESGVFAVSILKSYQAHLSAQFAGFVPLPEGEDRFYGVEIMTQATGVPILKDSLAWMDCRLTTIHPVGTTGIIVGEVIATGQSLDGDPLVYHNRGYYDITLQPK